MSELSEILERCKLGDKISADDLRTIFEEWPWLVENPALVRRFCAEHGLSWNEFVLCFQIIEK